MGGATTCYKVERLADVEGDPVFALYIKRFAFKRDPGIVDYGEEPDYTHTGSLIGVEEVVTYPDIIGKLILMSDDLSKEGDSSEYKDHRFSAP